MPWAPEVGSGQQDLSHKADLLGSRSHRLTDSTKILMGVWRIVTVNQLLSTRLLSRRMTHSLEKVSWAHECTPTQYRTEL